MTINACDLRIFQQKGLRFRPGKESRIVCFTISAIGVIILFVALDNYDLSSYTFSNLAGIGGTLTVIGFVAFRSIKRQPPPINHVRTFYDQNNPLPAFIVRNLIRDLCSENTGQPNIGFQSRINVYRLDSKILYFDYDDGKTTITAPLNHLLKSIPWKEIKSEQLPSGYLNSYIGTEYTRFNTFLRTGGNNSYDLFFCINYNAKKRILYEVICISNEMNKRRNKVSSSMTLFRATNLPLSQIQRTHKVEKIICDAGFWSTSKTWHKAFAIGLNHPIYYTIKKPKNGFDLLTGELEVLFHPFTPFRVISINQKLTSTEVTVEEV